MTAKTTSGEINIQDHDSKYNLEASSTRRYRYYFIGKPQDAVITGQSAAGDVTILMKKIKCNNWKWQ